MANNFKVSGATPNYIAKLAPGAASGTGTAESPKAFSSAAFIQGTNILGAGTYIWPLGYTLPNNYTLVADGFVKLLGDTTTLQQNFAGGGCYIQGIYFEQWAGIFFGTGGTNYGNCIFDVLSYSADNCKISSYNGNFNFTNCIFSNVGLFSAGLNNGNSPRSVNNCLLINSFLDISGTFGASSNLNSSYLDATSGIVISNGANSGANNCNVDPAITNGTTNRGIKILGAGWTNGVGQVGSTNGISQAPQFNSVPRFDFTLNANSPHVALGIGPTQLGAATSFTLASSVATGGTLTTANTSVTSSLGGAAAPILSFLTGGDNFQTNSQGGWALVPTAGGTFRSAFTTGVLTINANGPVELSSLNFVGALNINTDFVCTDPFVPQLQNNNVPDYNNGTLWTNADRKPNRMTMRMRWSTLANPDLTIASHWVSGMTLVEMEWFAKPTYNLAGYVGNGDVAYNPGVALPVLARTVQIEHTVRNNYGA